MLVFKLGLCYDITSVQQHNKYSVDKMMDAWAAGNDFCGYNCEVNRICNSKEAQFYNAIFNYDVDEACTVMQSVLEDAATDVFAAHGPDGTRPNSTHELVKEKEQIQGETFTLFVTNWVEPT